MHSDKTEKVVIHKVRNLKQFVIGGVALVIIAALFGAFVVYQQTQEQTLSNQLQVLKAEKENAEKELTELKNTDQIKRNDALEAELKSINTTYNDSLLSYEKIQDLKAQKQDTASLDKLFASILSDLSKKNFASGTATLTILNKEIDKKTTTIASSGSSTASNAPVSNTPPGSGFSSQQVKTDNGTFLVSIVAADLNSTRVIVDTASDSDCGNNCPVMPLGNYVSRSSAFAGINGNFFCPPEYPQCAGKTNSFDTLLMNKNKHYFNSDNNKYSTVPLMYIGGTSVGVRGQSLDWGRDTGVDAVIANHPLYIAGGNNQFGGSSDPKITSKGARTFLANKGTMIYIGIVYGASAGDAAAVLKAMGMDNALGLDQGGSTALWYGGYKAGPGRNIPSAVLFVRK